MEMRIVEKSENVIEVELPGETETILNLLKQKLLKNDKVVSATYLLGHPMLDAPKFYLEVSDKKPEQHLRNAAKELRAAFDELETQLLQHAR